MSRNAAALAVSRNASGPADARFDFPYAEETAGAASLAPRIVRGRQGADGDADHPLWLRNTDRGIRALRARAARGVARRGQGWAAGPAASRERRGVGLGAAADGLAGGLVVGLVARAGAAIRGLRAWWRRAAGLSSFPLVI